MNADIVHLLCKHLDLSTLLCFAAACPQWSAIVYRHLKRKPNTTLWVKFTRRGCDIGYRRTGTPDELQLFSTARRFWSRKFVIRKVMETFPQCVWENAPSAAMDFTVVHVRQDDNVPVYPELYVPLTKIKTKVLNLRFSQRNLARGVLQTISFRPKPVLLLYETSFGEDKESILRKDQLEKFKEVQYNGRMEMLTKDLLMALDSHCVELAIPAHTSTEVEYWATSTLQKYMMKHSEVQRIEGGPLKYKIKRIGEGKKHRKARARKICVCNFTGSRFDLNKGINVKLSVKL